MNIHVSVERSATELSTVKWRNRRFKPRCDILKEVIAGSIWMQLDLPEDVSRSELETFAHDLVSRINADASENAVENDLGALQADQFCKPIRANVIRELARLTILTVKRASI